MNWALDNIESDSEWVLRLDADERLTPELHYFLGAGLDNLSPDVTAVVVRLRIYFLGRWIRHGGMYPVWLLRVWRRRCGRCEDRWMDEHVAISSGQSLRIRADLIHDNKKPLEDWIDKHNRYAARECRDLTSGHKTSTQLSGEARSKRWMKENLYGRLPVFTRAWLYWSYRYFLRFGFLDGAEGFAYHFFQALWYRSLVDVKVLESRSIQRETQKLLVTSVTSSEQKRLANIQ